MFDCSVTAILVCVYQRTKSVTMAAALLREWYSAVLLCDDTFHSLTKITH